MFNKKNYNVLSGLCNFLELLQNLDISIKRKQNEFPGLRQQRRRQTAYFLSFHLQQLLIKGGSRSCRREAAACCFRREMIQTDPTTCDKFQAPRLRWRRSFCLRFLVGLSQMIPNEIMCTHTCTDLLILECLHFLA